MVDYSQGGGTKRPRRRTKAAAGKGAGGDDDAHAKEEMVSPDEDEVLGSPGSEAGHGRTRSRHERSPYMSGQDFAQGPSYISRRTRQ